MSGRHSGEPAAASAVDGGPASRLRRYLPLLVPLLLGLLVYLRALANGFAGDDHDIIVNFPLIRDPHNLPLFFAMQDTLADGVPTGYYRPLGRLVYMVDYLLWGLNPADYHGVNLAMHLLTTWGWYLLVRRVAGGGAALVATSLFVVAPVNVESVAYITGRNNIQVACLLVFSLYAHLAGMEADSVRRRLWGLLSLVLYAAALLTKEFAVFFPLVLLAGRVLLTDPDGQGRWQRQVRAIIPYLLAAACYMVLRSAVLGGAAFPLAVSAGSLADSVRSIVAYLRLLLFPVDLAVTHDIATGAFLSGPQDWFSLLAVLLLVGLLPFTWFRDRTVAFFLCWFLVFLFPVCGIIAFNPVPVAERYLYVGSLGAYTVLTLLGMRWAERWRRTALLLCGVAVALFSLRTVTRISDWRDDLTLALSTVRSRPDSPVAHYLLGSAYFNREQNREALAAFRRSVELNPSFPHARMNLARTHHLLGQLDDAIREYRLSLEAMPDSAQLHGALADAYYQKGMLAEAAEQLRQKVALSPADTAARNNLTLVERELAARGGRR